MWSIRLLSSPSRLSLSSLYTHHSIVSLPPLPSRVCSPSRLTCFNPLRLPFTRRSNGCHDLVMVVNEKKNQKMLKKGRGFSAVCYAGSLFTTHNLQWISAISSAVLVLARGTAIQKSFLVPLFALQAPSSVISWMKGEYGIWTAFIALLVRLFFFIPGELELASVALLLVIVAPNQVMNLRGTQQGAIIALVIAAYLAFQHFTRAGNLQKAFDQGSIVATLAIICVTVISCLFLF